MVWTRLNKLSGLGVTCTVSRVYRLLDLVAHGFALGGEQQGWIRAALPLLGMLTERTQHLQSAILRPDKAEREGFRGAQFLDVRGSLQPPFSSHQKEIKCC